LKQMGLRVRLDRVRPAGISTFHYSEREQR
jgi:hypothetical protein